MPTDRFGGILIEDAPKTDRFGGISVDTMQAPPQEPGFVDRMGRDWQNRVSQVSQIRQQMADGQVNSVMGPVGIVGKGGFGPLADLGNEALSSGLNYAKEVPNAMLEGYGANSSALQEMANRPRPEEPNAFQRTVGPMVNKVDSALTQFGEDNPNKKLGLDTIGNAFMAIPAAEGLVGGTTKALGATGEAMFKSGEAGLARQKDRFVNELLTPKQTAAVREEQVGRTTEKGLLRSKEVEPDPRTAAAIEEVKKLPIEKGRSLQHNYNIIDNEISKEAEGLKDALKANDVFFPRKEFGARLNQSLSKLQNDSLLTGDAVTTAEKIVNKMNDLLKDKKSSASNLLQARKDLDNWVKAQKGEGAFDPAKENALSVALREIRTATNDFIDSKVKDVAVKDSLKKQSNLYTALDNIAPKAADEAKTVLGRGAQTVMSKIPVKGDLAKMGAVGLGTLGLGGTALLSPATAGLGLAGLTAYGTVKGLASPALRKGVGSVLRTLN